MSKIERIMLFSAKFSVFVFYAVLLLFTVKEIFEDEIILEPLSVPDELVEKGYSGEIIAEKLLDEVRRIELITRDLGNAVHFEDKTFFYNADTLNTNMQFVDIEIPGTNFTYRSLVRYFRGIFRVKGTTYLRGDIIFSENGIVLTLRNVSDSGIPSISVSVDSRDVEMLVQEKGGKALIQMTNPILLAMKSFLDYSNLRLDGVEDNQSALTELENIINYCLFHSPIDVADMAYTLLGYAYMFDDKENSILFFQTAIDHNDRYLDAYIGLMDGYAQLKRVEDVENIFDKIFKLGFPNSENIYLMMSHIYMGLKNLDKAFYMNEMAAKIAPHDFQVYLTWGINLQSTYNNRAAIEKFKKASALKNNDPYIYFHWGKSLFQLGQYKDSILMFKRAKILNRKLTSSSNDWIYRADEKLQYECDDEKKKEIAELGGFGCSKASPKSNLQNLY